MCCTSKNEELTKLLELKENELNNNKSNYLKEAK
jgi:hypothetical protein